MTYGPASSSKAGVKNVLSVLLAVTTAVLLVAVSMAQITEEGPAKRSLGRSIAVLSEIDSFLDDNAEGLRREAAASQGESVQVTGFPVDIVLLREAVLNDDDSALRSLMLAAAAERVYEEGPSAFQEDGSSRTSGLSTQRAIEEWMTVLRPGPHDAFVPVAAVSAGVAFVLGFALLLLSPVYAGVVRVGLSVSAGASSVLLVAGLTMLVLEVAAGGVDDYLASEFYTLVRDTLWAPVRNSIIFLGAGVALLLLGFVLTPRGRASSLSSTPT